MRATVLATVLLSAGAIVAGPAFANHGSDCDDYQYQEDAQAHYNQDPNDPDNLDGNDNDGIACEHLPRRGSAVPGGGAVPVGGVDTGRGGAAGGPDVVLPALVLAAGVVTTAVGVRARRRST